MVQEAFDFGNGPVPAHRHINRGGIEGGWVAETARVEKTVYVGEDAQIYGNARIFGNAQISGNARIYGNARIHGYAQILDNARVYDDACISGNARIFGDVRISHTEQVLTIGPIGSENGRLTVVFGDDGEVWCSRGCFGGTLAEFQAEIEKKPKGDRHRVNYLKTIKYIKSLIKIRRSHVDSNDSRTFFRKIVRWVCSSS